MSCFIMSDQAHAATANALEYILNSGFNRFGFDAPDSLYKALSDCRDRYGFYCSGLIFRRLYDLNSRAYAGRYKTDADTTPPEMPSVPPLVQEREREDQHEKLLPWHYKLAKLIDCEIYQASEDATRKDPLLLALIDFSRVYTHFLVSNTADYNAAPWARSDPRRRIPSRAAPGNKATRPHKQNPKTKTQEEPEMYEQTSLIGPQTAEVPAVRYYEINEETARNAHYCVHMGDYRPGSATAEYRRAVDKAAALVEAKKARVSPFYHDKLDALLDRYARRLAEWTNDYNRNQASYPSQFISGAGGYNMRKHEKQMSREETLWNEYDEIKAILTKIEAVGSGPVDLADPHAREMLTEQLQKLQNKLDESKALNAYYRKHKSFDGFPGLTAEAAAKLTASFADTKERCPWITSPVPDYELTSLRGKIKRVQARLDELDKRAEAAEQPADGTKFPGGEIVRNLEADRLQILFDEKPDDETRQKLKERGFRWSPRYNAWQRKLTDNAMYDARHALGLTE